MDSSIQLGDELSPIQHELAEFRLELLTLILQKREIAASQEALRGMLANTSMRSAYLESVRDADANAGTMSVYEVAKRFLAKSLGRIALWR
jgi:hypothetical protein